MIETRSPITLLTGFLGAGKSTLLSGILAASRDEKIALIINEFGEVGLDHDLIETTTEDVTLLASGCICCSVRGDLVKALPNLFARRDLGEIAFDRIVIETTGLSDPGPIQRTLVTDHVLAKLAFLDGTVTLVDALNGAKTLDAHFEAVSQASLADLLVLSKTDLADPATLPPLTARLRRLNPTATVINTGDVSKDPARLWAVSAVRRDADQHHALAWMAPQGDADPLANLSGLSPVPAFATAPITSSHEGRVVSASVTLDDPLDGHALKHWVDELMAMRGDEILRIKGLFFLKGQDAPQVFHGVQHTFDGPWPVQNWTSEDRRSRIVVIARDVSQTRLERTLRKLIR